MNKRIQAIFSFAVVLSFAIIGFFTYLVLLSRIRRGP